MKLDKNIYRKKVNWKQEQKNTKNRQVNQKRNISS